MLSLPNPAVLRNASPVAARTTPGERARSNPLAYWHLLSLDAPTVATLWTWFVARCFAASLSLFELAGMFLAVWMLYAGDRLLDARPSRRHATVLEARHRFHAMHRRAFLATLMAAAAGLLFCLPRLPRRELALDLCLGGLLTAWFLLIHSVGLLHGMRLPKEIAVGVFFAFATSIPAEVHRPGSWRAMLLPAALFGALCLLNGLLIHGWELKSPDGRGTPRASHPLIALLVEHVQPLAILCCAAALLLALIDNSGRAAAPLYAAVALSSALLLLVHGVRARLSKIELRALADLVLLSPLLLVVPHLLAISLR